MRSKAEYYDAIAADDRIEQGAAELVLLVDDDIDLRQAQAQWFRQHGYDVVESMEGNEALMLYRKLEPAFVLTDYMFIPGRTIRHGVMLAVEIRKINPEQPIAIQSGEPDAAARALSALGIKGIPVLKKPYPMVKIENLLKKSKA